MPQLSVMIQEARDAAPEVMAEADIQQACKELAESILGSPDAPSIVAQLVRGSFMSARRTVTRNAERDHGRSNDRRGHHADQDRAKGGGSRKGRYQPRSKNSRDDAATARHLAFLNLPIGIPGEPFGEVLWGDATVPMLGVRREMYSKSILGLMESRSQIDDEIELIEKFDETGTMTLREAYAKAGKVAA